MLINTSIKQWFAEQPDSPAMHPAFSAPPLFGALLRVFSESRLKKGISPLSSELFPSGTPSCENSAGSIFLVHFGVNHRDVSFPKSSGALVYIFQWPEINFHGMISFCLQVPSIGSHYFMQKEAQTQIPGS